MREILVQRDDHWEEWGLEQLVENLRRYVGRNPLRDSEDNKRSTEDFKHRPWMKEKAKLFSVTMGDCSPSHGNAGPSGDVQQQRLAVRVRRKARHTAADRLAGIMANENEED